MISNLLSNSQINPMFNNGEALFLAVLGGHTNVVRKLLVDPRIFNIDDIEKEGQCRIIDILLVAHESKLSLYSLLHTHFTAVIIKAKKAEKERITDEHKELQLNELEVLLETEDYLDNPDYQYM
jgi:hypothetical protein